MKYQRLLRHRIVNWLHSSLILSAMASLLSLLGWAIAGVQGVVWAVFTGTLFVFITPQLSARRLLRSQGAREIHPALAPDLYDTARDLARRADLEKMPHLHCVPTTIPNAFAVGGPNNSALAITDGLMRNLSPRELRGVLAHEISHIKHNDTGILRLAEVVRGLTRGISIFGLSLIFLGLPVLWGQSVVSLFVPLLLLSAPIISGLLQLALSRTREFAADMEAVRLTGDPVGLASALAKLERLQRGFFSRLLQPVGEIPLLKWLRSHPEGRERIRRLLDLRTTREAGSCQLSAFSSVRNYQRSAFSFQL